MDVRDLRDAWNTFGRTDPMWAVLTDPERAGGRWDPEEFFATGRREIAEVMRLLDSLVRPPPARDAALDFGCGVGRLTRALADHFATVTGVDIAPSMVAEAQRLTTRSGCRFVLNERPDLQVFPDASFDLVYTTIVLQHMPPTLALGYVAEFARVLRPGGVAVLTVPSRPSDTLVGRLYRVVPRPLIHAYLRRRFGAAMQMHAIPMETLLPALTHAGLRVERVDPDTSPGPNWVGFRYVVSRT
ncbi:class I SAM-dependent methyltransferase [Geodermatophilus ruber]|uniref:Methyltransferase domain-containing protein n=1 Tax=Geodermatophilus ruber TaxID=504800 RepID=A0A1I4L4N6_9ACTN|nr:class I SAM-dependent methyltransferase [Geodermatophilus ruber]SFL85881.1 Methyltransferase domain-containing protein [Geodermatophilus ruber]